jgi:hypothetical protein
MSAKSIDQQTKMKGLLFSSLFLGSLCFSARNLLFLHLQITALRLSTHRFWLLMGFLRSKSNTFCTEQRWVLPSLALRLIEELIS